ncbi:MAG: LCP family protein, partial [Frankia sp.]|nr:LCP family protein [Frankia sp.]
AGRAPEDEPEPAPAAAGPAGPARRAGAAPSGRAGAASGGRAGRRRARHSAGKASLPAGLSPRERSRPGLARVLLTALSAILSATVLLVCGVGYAAVRFYDGKVDRTTLRTERVEGTRPPQVQHGRETWLLVGSDVRTGSDAAEVGGARSDTMIIAILGAHGDTTLVSIPRDLRVTIPAYTDDDGDRHRSRTDKVNAAFSLGGPTLLLRTLENVTGLRIDHFAEIDFNGFRQMSSALGGVEVCLVEDPFVERFTDDRRRVVRSTNLNDPSSGFVGHPGVNVLEGENALAFVRQRHGFADGDLSRIRRQQAFLGAVFRKVTSGDFLTDPAKLTRFLSAVTEATVLDDDTSISDLRVLAERLRGMSSGQVRFTTIPLSGSIARPVYYLTYDEATVRAFFEQIVEADKAGDDDGGATGQPGAPAPGASPTASPTPTVAPAEIRLTVLNGTPTGGMGTEAANTLRTAGYHIVAVDGTEERDALRTEVRYAAGSDTDAAAAARLVEDVPGARAVPDPALTPGGITLVIGQDYVDGDTTIVAAAASAGRASATPSASPRAYYTQAPVTAAEGCVK